MSIIRHRDVSSSAVSTMPIPAALQQTLDELLAEVPRWMSRLAHDTRALLQSPTTTRSLRGTAGGPLFDAEIAVNQHHPLWSRRVAELLEQRWRADFDAVPAGAAARRAPSLSLDSLSLVDEDQAEENIELLRIVQAVSSSQEAVLRELQSRTATLAGHDRVRSQSNPLRPELMARAVWDAAGVLGLAGTARLTLLRAMAQPLADALGRVCREALKRLEDQGVQPAAWRATALPDRRVPAPTPSGFDVTRPGALDALRGRMRPQNGGTPSGNASLDALDADVQRLLAFAPAAAGSQVVNRVRERLPMLEAAARHIADRQVMELLAGLIDALIGDAALREPVRAALARLQVPLLRLALREPRLLDDYRHPAWRLVDGLSSHTLGFDDDEDVRLCALMQGVDAVFAELAASGRADGAAFAQALGQFETLARVDLQAESMEAQAIIERLERTERRRALRTGLRRMAQAHVHHANADSGLPGSTGARVEPVLAQFLTGPWVDAMAEIALRDGEDSPAARGALALVDDVIDSLRPLRNPGERERLVARVPSIVQRIEQGCALIGLAETERQAVLDLLMTRHRELLRGDMLRGELPMAVAPEETPEEIVRRMREEPEPKPAGEPAFTGDTVYDVGSLPTVPAALMDDEAGQAAPRDWLRHLAPGTWVRLVARGSWTVARLLWVGPAREMWLFSDAQVGMTHALTRSALERLVAQQLAAPLEERGLLERAVDDLLSRAR